MPTLPGDLQDVLSQIEAADRAGDQLASSVSDAQFHWQPDQGRSWSIGHCLEHLGLMNHVYGSAVREGVELAQSRGWRRRGPIASFVVGRWFIRSMEPPVTRRLRTPSKAVPPGIRTRDEIVALYHKSHGEVRRLIEACADLDVNRATFQNPFLPLIRVRVGTGFRVIAAHDRRHLWQAERVKAAPGFPTR